MCCFWCDRLAAIAIRNQRDTELALSEVIRSLREQLEVYSKNAQSGGSGVTDRAVA